MTAKEYEKQANTYKMFAKTLDTSTKASAPLQEELGLFGLIFQICAEQKKVKENRDNNIK